MITHSKTEDESTNKNQLYHLKLQKYLQLYSIFHSIYTIWNKYPLLKI